MTNFTTSFKSEKFDEMGYQKAMAKYKSDYIQVISDPKNAGLVSAADNNLNAKMQLIEMLPKEPKKDEFFFSEKNQSDKLNGLIATTAAFIALGAVLKNSKTFKNITAFIAEKSASLLKKIK